MAFTEENKLRKKTLSMEQEAWLSGKIEDVSPILMPAAHALLQAVRDIEKSTKILSNEELWMKPNDAPSVGFHLLHIAGSIDRLLTYSHGEKLSEAQFAELRAETEINEFETVEAVLSKVFERTDNAIDAIKSTPQEILFEERTVGRKELPTNVFGLLFHIAEHTQRHVGQIITTAKLIGMNQNNQF
jgi:uncharacterized damage-inducible protein DinB